MTAEQETRIVDALNELAKEVHDVAMAHGWHEEKRPFGEIIALCHSELSEALEAYRNDEPMFWIDNKKPEGMATEMCDCVIRIFDYLADEGVDVGRIIMAKIGYNKTRSWRHNGKKI